MRKHFLNKMKKISFILALICIFSAICIAQTTETQATEALNNALANIKEMQDAGFGTTYVMDTFILLNYSYVNKNYDNVLKRAEEIATVKERAFKINDSFGVFEEKLKKYVENGLNVSDAEAIYAKAKNEFQKEMYDTCEDTLADAYAKLEEIKTENIMSQTLIEAGKKNIAYFIKENLLYIIIAVIIIFILAVLIHARLEVMIARKRLSDFEIERNVIYELMKKAQIECYQNRTMSYDEYKAKMKKFKERLVHINEEMPALKLKAIQELPTIRIQQIKETFSFMKRGK